MLLRPQEKVADMTTLEAGTHERPKLVEDNYLTHTTGLKSWLLTVDHKRIGLMYLVSVLGAFFMGGVFALLVRTQLLTPEGTIMGQDQYNQAFTLHGAIMVFLVIIPSVPASLGNFIPPVPPLIQCVPTPSRISVGLPTTV